MSSPFLEDRLFLEETLAQWGLSINLEPAWKGLVALASALEQQAKELHLTAVKGIGPRLRGPFLEALILAAHLPSLSPVADLGTGAGIPGLVIKLVRPELTVHLVEAYAPRVAFMRRFIQEFGIKNAFVHCCHIGREDCGLKMPLALARGYGEVSKFVLHAWNFFHAQKAYYLWRYHLEPWHKKELPMRLTKRYPYPKVKAELLIWESLSDQPCDSR